LREFGLGLNKHKQDKGQALGLVILILLIGIPLIEISLFIKVGGIVGGWTTVGLILLTAVVGLSLVRAQGLGIINKLNRDMAVGAFPVGAAFEGIALFIAGAMLITPGFLTDTLGFLLLIPPLRQFLGEKIAPNVHFRGFSARTTRYGPHPGAGPDILGEGPEQIISSDFTEGTIIEGEFSEIKEDGPNDGPDDVAGKDNQG